MDHPQPITWRIASGGSEQNMTSSPSSGSARQLSRRQGLARMSAVTAGVGAASVLGAVGLAITLAGSTAVGTQTSTSAAASDDTAAITSDLSSDQTDDGFRSQLQRALAPTATDNQPAATSGGS